MTAGARSHREIGARLRGGARDLRQAMTEPERRFCEAARARRFLGLGFRRQVSIPVDFVCHGLGPIVEIDGATHADTPAVARDRLRTARLATEGYRMLRFWNNEIMDNLDGVAQRLTEEVGAFGPPTQPSPTKGEG